MEFEAKVNEYVYMHTILRLIGANLSLFLLDWFFFRNKIIELRQQLNIVRVKVWEAQSWLF